MLDFILLVGGGFILICIIVRLCSGNSEEEEQTRERRDRLTQYFEEQASSNHNESSSICDTSDLRGDFRPVTLPAISQEQRDKLAATVKRWATANNTRQGGIIEVVGGRYRTAAAKDVYKTVSFGTKLTLKPDPDNEDDDTAVKVYARKCHIGYVPSEISSTIYWYCILDKIADCYVVEECNSGRITGLKFVLFVKEEANESKDDEAEAIESV